MVSEVVLYVHCPSDTVSNDVSHTAEEDVFISAVTRTVICCVEGVMKSVDVCTHEGEAMALDGMDWVEKIVIALLLLLPDHHSTLKPTLHDAPVHM